MPPSKVFVHINPVQVTFDLASLLWLNSFALNLHECLLRTSVGGSGASMQTSSTTSSSATINPGTYRAGAEPSLMYMDVKLEAILPRITFESAVDVHSQRDRPKLMQAQVSRLQMTNIRETGTSRADLAQALHSLQEGSLVFSSGFPAKDTDMCIVTDRILSHVAASDVAAVPAPSNVTTTTQSTPSSPPSSASTTTTTTCLPKHILWTEPRDVWCIKLDPVWVEFYGARSTGTSRSIPFVDAVPITLWVHGRSGDETLDSAPLVEGVESNSSSSVKTADLHVIAHVANLISVQIDHYQFLFLLRLSEQLTELSTFLTLDRNRILKPPEQGETPPSMIVGCVVPQVEVTLIMPSQSPGKESNGGGGGDCESVVPDSGGSMTEDFLYNVSAAGNAAGDGATAATASPSANIYRGSMNPFSTSIDSTASMPAGLDPLPYEGNCSNVNNSHVSVAAPVSVIKSHPDSGGGVGGGSVASTATSAVRRGRNSVVATTTNFTKEVMSMKKGFLSFMTPASTASNDGPDDISCSDTISVQSDVSSDSENFFVMLADSEKPADCMDLMFK